MTTHVRPDRARGPLAEPDRHGQRAGQGAAAGGVQPDRARGRRPRQRGVRPPRPDGRPGRHRHARPHQLARASAPRASSTSTRSTSLEPGDVLITNDPYKTAGQLLDVTVLVPVLRDGRVIALLRLDDPPHRRRRLRHRRRRPRRVRGRPVDPDLQAACRGASATTTSGSSSSPTCASPTTWPATSTPRWRRARSARSGCWRSATSTASTTSRTSPTRSSSAREAATRALDPRAAGRARTASSAAARPRRRQPDRHRRARSPSTPTPARSSSTTTGSSGASPCGHQRRQELHPRLHDVHRAQRAQPRDPEQPRQPGADQGRGARGHRSSTRCRPQPGTARHVVGMFLPNALLKALAQVAARAGDGRGLGRGVDDAGQRQPRRRPPVHHGDVHLRRRRRRPGHEARADGLLVPDRCRRGADRGGRGHRRRSASAARQLRPGSGGARRAARRARPDDRVLGRHDPAVAAQRRDQPPGRAPPEGIFGGEPGAAGRFSSTASRSRTQARVTLQPDDVVRLDLPGGGGYGARRRARSADDAT